MPGLLQARLLTLTHLPPNVHLGGWKAVKLLHGHILQGVVRRLDSPCLISLVPKTLQYALLFAGARSAFGHKAKPSATWPAGHVEHV